MSEQIYDPMDQFRVEIKKMLAKGLEKLGIEPPEASEIDLESPPEGLGDFAYPCFSLAPLLKKNPNQIAAEVAKVLPEQPNISYNAAGPYLNFSISDEGLVVSVVSAIFALGASYGHLPPKGVKVILEHTSANPTDKLHVGRARNPIIGDTLARIFRCAGYDVETQYYVDDMGKQTARKILEARYDNDWDRDKFKTGYQWATSVTTDDSEFYDLEKVKELDAIMDGLERGEPDALKEGRKVCDDMMDNIIIPSLEKINVKIDRYVNESQFMLDNSVNTVIDGLNNSEYCGTEDGAHYIDLTQFDLKSGKEQFFFIRADGKSLYATRDIAYHHWKFSHCDIAINILGEDHKLEAEYVRIGLEITGTKRVPESIFYAFVNLPEGRMSTRKGKVVYIDDLLDEALERAVTEVKKRREDINEAERNEIAQQVGMGAIRYNLIRVQAEKKIVFKWEDALNFEGDSAPFIQYAHARARSILRKAEDEGHPLDNIADQFNAKLINDPYELMLTRILGKLPGVVGECAQKRKAHQLASYAHELAAAFNQFYRECSVLQAESTELVLSRLALVDATRCVLGNALTILGISAPEKM